MSEGENIFKRKDGRWEARFIKNYDQNGKIRYGFCYGSSYREAKLKVMQKRAEFLSEERSEESFSRLKDFCESWLEQRKIKIRESTYIKYSAVLKKYIIPKLGNLRLYEINDRIITEFSFELLEKDRLCVKTVRDILVILNGILKFISKRTEIKVTFPEINYPKETKKDIRVLSKDEQTLLVDYLLKDMNFCKFGLLLSLYTGLRIGELCALKWGDINLKDKTVYVTHSLQRIKDINNENEKSTKILLGRPKSDKSVRLIPLTDQVSRLCEKMKKENNNAFILTGSENFMEPRLLQYYMKKFSSECGLKGVHCHTLRHTFATRAVEAGFEIKSLSEILGHSSTTVTLERYVHSSLELKRENMNKLWVSGF